MFLNITEQLHCYKSATKHCKEIMQLQSDYKALRSNYIALNYWRRRFRTDHQMALYTFWGFIHQSYILFIIRYLGNRSELTCRLGPWMTLKDFDKLSIYFTISVIQLPRLKRFTYYEHKVCKYPVWVLTFIKCSKRSCIPTTKRCYPNVNYLPKDALPSNCQGKLNLFLTILV